MIIRGMLIASLFFCTFLTYRIFRIEAELLQVQRNTAIAVISAENANKKIGAFAPYFREDNEIFANAWIDDLNMPLAIFPDEVLLPLREELAQKRQDPVMLRMKADTFP